MKCTKVRVQKTEVTALVMEEGKIVTFLDAEIYFTVRLFHGSNEAHFGEGNEFLSKTYKNHLEKTLANRNFVEMIPFFTRHFRF